MKIVYLKRWFSNWHFKVVKPHFTTWRYFYDIKYSVGKLHEIDVWSPLTSNSMILLSEFVEWCDNLQHVKCKLLVDEGNVKNNTVIA